MSQPEGAFPRVNLQLIKSGQYDNLIVSLVCRTVEYDGESIMQVECADGGAYNVAVGEGYDFIPNKFVEIMGHLENGETPLSHFVTRPLGENMSLEVYNEMLTQVFVNPKYKDLFNAFQEP